MVELLGSSNVPLASPKIVKIFEKPQRSTYTTTKLIVPEMLKYFHIIYRIIINNACKSIQVIVYSNNE